MKMGVPEAENLKILAVGNNPIELTFVFNHLRRMAGKTTHAEIAFDQSSLFERLKSFIPDYILLDDNIGRVALGSIVRALLNTRKTKNIPITILKNSNYTEAINTGAVNYVLKENVTGDSLYRVFKNSLKIRRTQDDLKQAYRKRKGQLKRILLMEELF